MLKKKCGLFLGLVVLAGSACVTPTHASSALPLVLTHIQAGSAYSALSELVVVYNNSLAPVDVTGLCVMNKANVRFACVTAPLGIQKVMLPGYGSMVFMSPEFADEHDIVDESVLSDAGGSEPMAQKIPYGVITSQNHSSGSIVASSDSIKLVAPDASIVDTYSWGSAPATGKLFMRVVVSSTPTVYAATGGPGDWRAAAFDTLPEQQAIGQGAIGQPGVDGGEPLPTDTPPNTPSTGGRTNPSDPVNTDDSHPSGASEIPTTPQEDPYINELFPNPSGSDAGNEFIELFNPNNTPLLLVGYSLAIGPNLENIYAISDTTIIEPHGYLALTNTSIKFTLLNTASMVQLKKNGVPIGEIIAYASPKSGYSWSRLGDAWVYVSVPSPNAVNVGNEAGDIENVVSLGDAQAVLATVKPCAANQYRNPETGRCKLIASGGGSSLAPCALGETRNSTTNRCVGAKATSTLTPCKEGQQRNPTTGRCATIKKMTQADYGLTSSIVDESAHGVALYSWLAIGATILAVIGYMVWEWRVELRKVAAHVWLAIGMNRRFIRRSN